MITNSNMDFYLTAAIVVALAATVLDAKGEFVGVFVCDNTSKIKCRKVFFVFVVVSVGRGGSLFGLAVWLAGWRAGWFVSKVVERK